MSEDARLVEALANCREEEVRSIVREMIARGVPAAEIVAACNRGMAALGNRFESGDCFLPELMFGGMVMKSVLEELRPLLGAGEQLRHVGRVVMGTVQHDVHDIGKDIVVTMLRGVGFDVVDLGVDVPPERFVEAIRQHQPQVVGMSILLTTCYRSVTATVEAIRQASLRQQVRIMVGGAAASDLLREVSGCDFYGKTAIDGVNFAAQVAGSN
jgi:5-methyltetrahydrofolate--homocysteine methyltransferase